MCTWTHEYLIATVASFDRPPRASDAAKERSHADLISWRTLPSGTT